ncbi:OsmC family protein [Carboxylicivirga sp. N1Y90]|uniref:OsmC family protein n=1 Tax=Carboxylicivirga fragile TaxID=3417571 RepID=UPI003D34000B|nr:OsmC family protein [Marinilabiliaceae bacterium N1Y90]
MTISTLKVGAKMNEGFRTEVECSHNFVIDQPKPAGTDEGPNPMEIFLASLPACICAIGRIIANQKRLPVRGINVKLEGDIDKNFLLGKTEEGRAGFIEIRTFVEIDADMSMEEKQAYLHEIEKRCPIADNMQFTSKLKSIVVA